jgi:hypothetical protein
MKLNLLFDHRSIDWENMSNDLSDCFDKLQEVIGKSQEDENERFKPNSFDELAFSWGEIHELFQQDKLLELNASWFLPYAYGTFSQIYSFPLSPSCSDTLENLNMEFPNDCNSLFGCKNDNDSLVYDLESYFAFKNECERPKIKLPPNQINQLIDTRYKHLFERIDTPTITQQGNLHGEQIQIHLNSGNTKNIGALNLDGTWKHQPENRYLPISNDAKSLLLEWGFILPQ